jgi:multiple sugar transport system substrate-binding protein
MISTRSNRRHRRRAIVAGVVAVVAASLAACGSSGGKGGSVDAGGLKGTDDGTTLTLWTRAPLEFQAKLLVNAYNKSHKNQVKLTIVPNDDYVSKVGAAAGSGDLPDLFAADIVYVPNWTKSGLFSDITSQISKLPFADKINKGHLDAGTYQGKHYVLPFVLDLSAMFWNKTLYREAGLDPDKGPTTLAEFVQQAKAVQALHKKGVYGTYFGGNCGGCNVFTWFPMIWGAGQDVMNQDGTKSLLDSDTAKQVYSAWHDLWSAGAVDPASKDETGATWVGPFQEGKIGVMPYPFTLLATAAKTVDVGVAPLPGVDGGASTFVGGDGIGISKDSSHTAQAWNFLYWLMSEDAQVNVLAANDSVVSRGDLADNKYSRKDPRILAISKVAASPDSKTPVAVNFQQAFNAPGSPWVTLLRDQVFEGKNNVEDDNNAITDVLGQS